jgi:hypothetical protein
MARTVSKLKLRTRLSENLNKARTDSELKLWTGMTVNLK